MNIKPMTRTTVTDQVLDQIGGLILNQEIKPGEKLPTERDLAARLGTTRARVREALRALALIGLIETRQGDGTYVTRSNMPVEAFNLMFFRELTQYDNLYEAREMLEPSLYALAAVRLTDQDLAELERTMDECEAILQDAGSAESFLERINHYDEIVIHSTRNGVIEQLMAAFHSMSRNLYLKLVQEPTGMTNSLEHRRKIVRALRTRDAEVVKKAVLRHIDSARAVYRAGRNGNKS